jgi:flagellar biosynthesis chaperone FliJ
MTQARGKMRALARLVALRQRMEEQAEVALKRARLDAAETEALLATPWAVPQGQYTAADLANAQAMRDVGYGYLTQLEAAVDVRQGELSDRHREHRQVEVLMERAQKEAAATAAKREARDTEDWLRRQKKDDCP